MRYRMTRRRVAIVLALGLILALALAAIACGGGEDKTTTTGGGAAAGSTTVQITMKDNSFDPKEVTVPAGKEITFNLDNKGQAIHNMAVSVDGKNVVSQPDSIRGGSSGKLVATFSKAGTFDFKCEFHPAEMTGKITVK